MGGSPARSGRSAETGFCRGIQRGSAPLVGESKGGEAPFGGVSRLRASAIWWWVFRVFLGFPPLFWGGFFFRLVLSSPLGGLWAWALGFGLWALGLELGALGLGLWASNFQFVPQLCLRPHQRGSAPLDSPLLAIRFACANLTLPDYTLKIARGVDMRRSGTFTGSSMPMYCKMG